MRCREYHTQMIEDTKHITQGECFAVLFSFLFLKAMCLHNSEPEISCALVHPWCSVWRKAWGCHRKSRNTLGSIRQESGWSLRSGSNKVLHSVKRWCRGSLLDQLSHCSTSSFNMATFLNEWLIWFQIYACLLSWTFPHVRKFFH